MRTTGAAVAVVLLLASAGCGSSRPDSADVAKALQNGVTGGGQTLKLPKQQAACVAKVFVGSHLSDATLTAMVSKHVYEQSRTNDAELARLSPKLKRCRAA